MTPVQFVAWLAEMRSAGVARTDLECARLLGWAANSVVKAKRRGVDRRTALACAALLHGLQPYA